MQYIFLIMLVYTVMFLLNSLRERTKGLKVWSIVCLVFLNAPYILSLLFLGRILYDLLGRYTKSRAFFLIVNLAISGSMTFSPSRFGVYEIRGRDLMFIFLLIGTIAATRLIVRGDFRLTRNINSIVVIFISFPFYVPDSQLSRYFLCSSVSTSIVIPMEASFSLPTSLSISRGTG